MVDAEPITIAVFAKAPKAGLAKTRLIPALGAHRAARLQRWLTRRALSTAWHAGVGAITLWCAPDARHPFFRALQRHAGIACRAQHGADLGQRMLHAFEAHCTGGPLLIIGTDCPALTADHLRVAARSLRDGDDAVLLPAEDGGYVLIGLRRPLPSLFEGVAWGTASVLEETRTRLGAAGSVWSEPSALWDVDRPTDLPRLLPFARSDARLQAILSDRASLSTQANCERDAGGWPRGAIAGGVPG